MLVVTNLYTKLMLVVRDEVFDRLGIERRNQARVATEQAAQAQRSGTSVQSRRVDTQQPMYRSSRASFGGSGGGSFDLLALLMLLPLLWPALRNRSVKLS